MLGDSGGGKQQQSAKKQVTVAPTVEKRVNNGIPEVNVAGVWKKAIGKDKNGNYIAED